MRSFESIKRKLKVLFLVCLGKYFRLILQIMNELIVGEAQR